MGRMLKVNDRVSYNFERVIGEASRTKGMAAITRAHLHPNLYGDFVLFELGCPVLERRLRQ
jgi:hypothetical protein